MSEKPLTIRLEKLMAIQEAAARAAEANRRVADLIGELRLSDFEGGPVAREARPAASKEAPPALSQANINKAAAHRFHHQCLPSWLPPIGEADRKRIARAVEAFAEEARNKAAVAAPAEPTPPASPKDTAEFGSLLPKSGEAWSNRPKKPAKRLSFRGALQQYREQHGEEVVTYALNNLLGTGDRTAKGLHMAFGAQFLGTHPDATAAGACFARAHKRSLRTEGEALGQLRLARHSVTHADGSVSVWSHHVKPGDAPAAASQVST